MLPLSSCWGENRAKFSDVVARNQETASPIPNLNHVRKSQTNISNLSSLSTNLSNTDVKNNQYVQPQSTQELSQTSNEYNSPSKSIPLCITSLNKEKILDSDTLILQPDSQHSNSYFMNTFAEHPVSDR